MDKRKATWLAAVIGLMIGMIAVLLQTRTRAADGRDILTLAVAMALPAFFVHFGGNDDATL